MPAVSVTGAAELAKFGQIPDASSETSDEQHLAESTDTAHQLARRVYPEGFADGSRTSTC